MLWVCCWVFVDFLLYLRLLVVFWIVGFDTFDGLFIYRLWVFRVGVLVWVCWILLLLVVLLITACALVFVKL